MQLMDISKNVAYDLVKQEGFPVIKIKSTYRVPKQAFHEWLNRK
jgi:excisionase family DNA binding protein